MGTLLVIISTFLVWFTFTVRGTSEQAVKGVANDDGTVLVMAVSAVTLATAVLVLGLILAIRGRGRGLAIAGLVVSLILLVITGYAAFAPEAAIVALEAKEIGEGLGVSESEAKRLLEEAFDTGRYSATAGVGSFLAFAGSLLALGASIAGIATGGRKPEAVVAPPAPGAFPPAAPPPPPPSAPPAP
ncbi:MAG: hypothetical protein WD770_09640 [Actinomycetota bacterium]